ncbi:hypothetical protein J1N35_021976 [Gossypium stocksii]|uniref:Uncharacterized protein n=1 Tax=Gossypium stocksii TaxID=47602 RepID=A0A9D3VFK5_9ROSI|nr:hypothetical protein J1N35_021976 [Gossypium stocksii]
METLGTANYGLGPRDRHNVEGKMIVFRGTNSSKKVNSLYVLNLVSKEWIQAECNVVTPSPHESHTTTFVGEDKVVIFEFSGEGEIVYLNDFHVLDLRTMRWTSPIM